MSGIALMPALISGEISVNFFVKKSLHYLNNGFIVTIEDENKNKGRKGQ